MILTINRFILILTHIKKIYLYLIGIPFYINKILCFFIFFFYLKTIFFIPIHLTGYYLRQINHHSDAYKNIYSYFYDLNFIVYLNNISRIRILLRNWIYSIMSQSLF